MNVTNLKARPKAVDDRISDDIFRPLMIKNKVVVENNLKHIAQPEILSDSLNTNTSVPLEFWLEHKDVLLKRSKSIAVQIAADQNPRDLVEDLGNIDCIVLPFVTNMDGRSYSHAYRLRKQYGYTKEIRATGDVKHDSLGFLLRVGVDAFELTEDQDLSAALTAFTDFSEVYQPSADSGQLIFARRRRTH